MLCILHQMQHPITSFHGVYVCPSFALATVDVLHLLFDVNGGIKTVASQAVAPPPPSAATPASARHSAGHQQRPAFRPSAPYRTGVYPRHNHGHGRRASFTRKPANTTSASHLVENKLNIQHRAALDINRHKPRGYIRSQLNRNSLHFFCTNKRS